MGKLSVWMPVCDESRTLDAIVERVLTSPIDMDLELNCVDDCSSDNPWEILQEVSHLGTCR